MKDKKLLFAKRMLYGIGVLFTVAIVVVTILAFKIHEYASEEKQQPVSQRRSFDVSIGKLKGHLGITSPDTTLYIQRLWCPTKITGTDHTLLVYEGEFFSSHRSIEVDMSVSTSGYFVPWSYVGWPETFLVMSETKMSDTLFYYDIHTSSHDVYIPETHMPIGYITPDGRIEFLKEFVISQEYLENKIFTFKNDFIEAYEPHMLE